MSVVAVTNKQHTQTQSYNVFNKSAINRDSGRDKLQKAIDGDTVRRQLHHHLTSLIM